MRLRPRPLGLRARITLAFALGSLLLSVTFSTSTWAFTRQSQLNQRESTAVERLYGNAQPLRDTLLAGGETNMSEYMASLPTTASQVLAVEADEGLNTSSSSQRVVFEDIPPGLRELVASGTPASMRYRHADEPVLAVGVPIPAADAQYYEVVSLTELERSFDVLAYWLTAASALTALAGATLGWWASRRTLLPLVDVGIAAEAIAGGRLDTRLESANDPDLAVLVSSFNEMAAALQARIERDARFASDVSHELRSPLMTLAASIEVLETRRDELPERSRAALDLLVHDVNRFQQLVGDLLEISRFDSGAAHLDLEPVVLAEFLDQAVQAATHEPVPVIAEGSLADAIVEVDKRRMARVVANLLDNAAKYAGGATSIRLSRHGDHIRFAVEDAGEGVAPEDRDRIFDRFSRGGTAGSRGTDTGTGLGLALVAEHVRLHGGTVRVENRSDGVRGASFVVTLPIAEHDQTQADPHRPESTTDIPVLPMPHVEPR
ncbi:MAG: sensor histidine kinase [Acidimicrobiales bacterium]